MKVFLTDYKIKYGIEENDEIKYILLLHLQTVFM